MTSVPKLDINYSYCKGRKENFLTFEVGYVPYLPVNNREKIKLNNNKFIYENIEYNIDTLSIEFEDEYVKILTLVINDTIYKVYISIK